MIIFQWKKKYSSILRDPRIKIVAVAFIAETQHEGFFCTFLTNTTWSDRVVVKINSDHAH